MFLPQCGAALVTVKCPGNAVPDVALEDQLGVVNDQPELVQLNGQPDEQVHIDCRVRKGLCNVQDSKDKLPVPLLVDHH